MAARLPVSPALGNTASKISSSGLEACPRIFKTGLLALVAFTTLSYTAIVISGETETGPSAQQHSFIQYDNVTRRFTVSVDNQPFDWVIKHLEKEAGIEFKISEGDHSAVTAQFENQPLEQAINLLLYGTSHLISSGDTIKIFVLSSEKDVVTTGPDTAPHIRDDVSIPDTADQPIPAGTNASIQTPDVFKRHLTESAGGDLEFSELRALFEQLPKSELNENKNRLLRNPCESRTTNIFLEHLRQTGADGNR